MPDRCLTGLIWFVYLYLFIVAVHFVFFLVCFAWWPSFVGSSVRSFSQEIVTAILGTFPYFSPLQSGGICLSMLACWFWSQGLVIMG